MTNLKRIRVAQGYSLRALAQKMDCTYGAIYRWEHAINHPHPGNAKRLQDVLGVPLDVLLAPNEQDHRPARSDGLETLTNLSKNPERDADYVA